MNSSVYGSARSRSDVFPLIWLILCGLVGIVSFLAAVASDPAVAPEATASTVELAAEVALTVGFGGAGGTAARTGHQVVEEVVEAGVGRAASTVRRSVDADRSSAPQLARESRTTESIQRIEDVDASPSALVADGSVKFKRWKRGDAIDKPLPDGSAPDWDTVRARYWKNRSDASKNTGEFQRDDLARMRRGLAPLDLNPRTGELEPRELHHVIPRRFGGPNGPENLRELTPDQHAEVDPFRIRPGITTTRGIQ